MSRETFMYLYQQLSAALRRQDTSMRKAISVEQRLAVTRWCLATPCEYRTIAHLFGIARSTVCEIVQETCTYHHCTNPPPKVHSISKWKQTRWAYSWIFNKVGCATVYRCHWWLPYSYSFPCHEPYWLQQERVVLNDTTRCSRSPIKTTRIKQHKLHQTSIVKFKAAHKRWLQ